MNIATKALALVIGLSALSVTTADAQPVNLSGQYVCVQACRFGLAGNPAYVTQNGNDINLLNEAGESARAWIDWLSSGRIWVESWHEGAVFSPDGMSIQFDQGTVWTRDLGPPPPPPVLPRRR